MRWLEEVSCWSRLRALGNSNLVRASVLMPAFGYMLLLNDNVHQYLTIKFDGWLLNYLPSVWRIWFLFYGSFFLAAATVAFSIFCAPDIKHYASPYELADAQAQHIVRLDKWRETFSTVKTLQEGMSQWEESLLDLPAFEHPAAGILPSKYDVSNALIYIWRIENIKHPRGRILLLCVYAVGLVLVVFPAIITFGQVTHLLFLKSLAGG